MLKLTLLYWQFEKGVSTSGNFEFIFRKNSCFIIDNNIFVLKDPKTTSKKILLIQTISYRFEIHQSFLFENSFNVKTKTKFIIFKLYLHLISFYTKRFILVGYKEKNGTKIIT